MLDLQLRPLKDSLIDPITRFIPSFITPLHLTFAAFLSGLLSCYLTSKTSSSNVSVLFWLTNRLLDCFDGALARHRNQASDLGGFLDLLGDFVVYSAIPVSCALNGVAQQAEVWHLWLSVSVVEATFHVNNFVLFYIAAVVEKSKATAASDSGKKESEIRVKELTSVAMRPALIEGFESGLLFTIMLVRPAWTEGICWTMATLVSIGICQRIAWLVPVII